MRSSGSSFAPASIIVSASRVPTTMRSRLVSPSSMAGMDGLTTNLLVDPPDAHGADRAEERQRRDHERRGGAVDREDVVRRDHVRAEHGADDLHLVAEALRPQRPDGAVDHPGGERRALGGAALALEEAAGDLARGVRALLDVDGQREEVRAFARLRPALRRREHHRVAGADDDGAVGLLRQLARLEGDLTFANGHRDRRATVGGNRSHFPIPPLFSVAVVESGV